MSRAMHNFQRPHEVTRPCRMKCGIEVEALQNGVLQDHPICSGCRSSLEREFRLAQGQRQRARIRKETS